MDKNFRVRTIITISMLVVALIGLYTFDSIPFKVIYMFFSVMSLIELFSFFKKKHNRTSVVGDPILCSGEASSDQGIVAVVKRWRYLEHGR